MWFSFAAPGLVYYAELFANLRIQDARGASMNCPQDNLVTTTAVLRLCFGLNAQLLPFTFDNPVVLQVNASDLVGRITGRKTLLQTEEVSDEKSSDEKTSNEIMLALDFIPSSTTSSVLSSTTSNYSIKRIQPDGRENQIATGTYSLSVLRSGPEPGSLALLFAGVLGLFYFRRTT